ncbi:MAG: hypothetical protein CM1200mP18_03310 [Gammaproteobacteria bacterium]|nr:MAG: hypothetical protein CM1200mP18_03310 [Gammaproteobacteria bacterium]
MRVSMNLFLTPKGPKPLVNAVRQVWASLFSERAMRYRRVAEFFGRDSYGRYCYVDGPAHCAGVAFSADPVTGKQDRIISRGAGATVKRCSGCHRTRQDYSR